MSNFAGSAKIPETAVLAQQIKTLLPKGSAWYFLNNGEKLLKAFAATDKQVLVDINTLQNNMLPQSTVALREEWQKSVSLPDECITVLPNDNLEILNRIRARGSESIDDYRKQFPNATIIEIFFPVIDEITVDFELIDDESITDLVGSELDLEIGFDLIDFEIKYKLWEHSWIFQIHIDDINESQEQFICKLQKEFSAHHNVIIDIILNADLGSIVDEIQTDFELIENF